MSEKHKKFHQIWSNQTDLGKKFGISAIAVGELLVKAGLKDPKTKRATEKALTDGFAKSTPLKDGTPFFMWNIDKLRDLISKDHKPLSKVDYWVKDVLETYDYAQSLSDRGEDKSAIFLADSAYEEVPKDIKGEVRLKVEEFFRKRDSEKLAAKIPAEPVLPPGKPISAENPVSTENSPDVPKEAIATSKFAIEFDL